MSLRLGDNGDTRAFDGAIVTLVNLENGELRVVHRAGYGWEEKSFARTGGKRVRVSFSFLDVIRQLGQEVDAWRGTWRIRTICTPLSIYQDLTGTSRTDRKAGSYEASVLSRAGRIDLWEGHYAKEISERYRQHGLDRHGEAR